MILHFISALLVAAPLSQDPKPPSKEQVKAAIGVLEAAFDEKEVEARTSALQLAEILPDKQVISYFAKRGLKDSEVEIRRAVIGRLGLLPNPDALKELHAYAKRDKRKLSKDPETQVALIKAIGRHDSSTSLKYLTDDLFGSTEATVVQARIMSLARIRDLKAVDELMSMMRLVSRRKIQNRMEDFRLALMVLTGVDHGKNQDRWTSWWNDNKKSLKLAEKAPRMPKAQQNRWDRYWDNPRTYERQKRRGERGNDPEDDKTPQP